jgi:hypothetical protein
MTRYYPILCLLLLATTALQAQYQRNRGYEIGGFLGITNYAGDINQNFSFKSLGGSLAAVGRYNFNGRTSLRFDVGAGRIAGRDSVSENSFQRARNLSFRTDYVDWSFNFEFNFFNLVHGSRDQYFTPYIFGGLAFAYYNPRAQLDGEWYALRDLGTEGQAIGREYSRVTAGMSIGFGFKLDLTEVWSLNAEIAGRFMGTDYLDDVSTVYPDMGTLLARRGEIAVRLSDRSVEGGEDVPIGAPGRQRGNSDDKDGYYTMKVGLVYYIGIVPCPSISRPQANGNRVRR